MNIIIIGAGKVGRELIERLCDENHNITVIDKDPVLLDKLMDNYDIMGISGNGTICETLKEANISHADILIATTDSDEVNMICSIMAKKMGVSSSIARVRNVEYTSQSSFMREEMGISLMVNPELDAAMEISRIINFPAALKIDTFGKGKLDLAEFKIDENSSLADKALWEINKTFNQKFLICAVQRDGKVFIPNGNFILHSGDKISITSEHHELVGFLKDLGLHSQKIKKVMIVGGGTIAYHLSKRLAETGIHVTIIEIDKGVCEKLNELLPKVDIICADGTEQDVLVEQGIENFDACISLTGIDEENIIISLFAGVMGVDKIITKINKASLMSILDSIGLDSIISPKSITADIIMRFTRARQTKGNSQLKSLYKIVDGKAEALEFLVTSDFSGLNTPLKSMKFKSNLLISGILRKENFIIPNGDDMITEGDRIIVITSGIILTNLNDILE